MRGGMFLTRPGLARRIASLSFAASLAAFSLLPAQEIDALAAELPGAQVAKQDSAQAIPADTLPASEVKPAPAQPSLLDSAVAAVSIAKASKMVLYLGGGDDSPWFHLGVLYAIEAYSVPIDSVVGTSWGAFVGALWAKGVSPDNIQRILLDPDMAPIFDAGENAHRWNDSRQGAPNIPVSETGVPSLRERFSIHVDSSGKLHRRLKPLAPDTLAIESALARLRLQESLLRHKEGFRIPFAVLGCDGVTGSTYENIFESLPVKGNDKSGEYCPYLALPAEDSPEELAVIAVAEFVITSLRFLFLSFFWWFNNNITLFKFFKQAWGNGVFWYSNTCIFQCFCNFICNFAIWNNSCNFVPSGKNNFSWFANFA